MEKSEENVEKLKNLLQGEISQENLIYDILKNKKQIMIEKVNEQINFFNSHIKQTFQKRKDFLIEHLNKQGEGLGENLELDNFVEKRIKILEKTEKIDVGFEILDISCLKDNSNYKKSTNETGKKNLHIHSENNQFTIIYTGENSEEYFKIMGNEIFTLNKIIEKSTTNLEPIEFELMKNKIMQFLIKNSTNAKFLSINNSSLKKHHLSIIDNILKKNFAIKSLKINGEKIFCSEKLFILASLIKFSSNTLENISLTNCNINEDALKSISKLFKVCNNVKNVNFEYNRGICSLKYPIFKNLRMSSNTLESLNLNYCNLNVESIKNISELFEVCTKIKSLNFGNNKCIGSTKHRIFENLKMSANSLENLNLRCCDLNEETLKNISELFKVCTKIKKLDFTENKCVGSTKHPIFKSLITSSKTLENIDFFGCDIKDEAIKNLTELFKDCTNIKSLNFSGNECIGLTKHPVFESLKLSSNKLETLNFDHCYLKEEAIKNLSELFENCSNLKNLHFFRNRDVGSTKNSIFKNLLMSSSTLETINLSCCDLNEDALRNISDLFRVCNKIKSVNFCGNSLVGSTNHAIFESLNMSSNTLEVLDLNGYDFNEKPLNDLSELFKVCTNIRGFQLARNTSICSMENTVFGSLKMSSQTLETLNLNGCDLDDETIEKISELLKDCTNIKSLNFCCNEGIGSTNLPIFESLKSSSNTLEDVSFSGCYLEDETIKNISELFKVCNSIKSINFCENHGIGSINHDIFESLKTSSNTLENLNLSHFNMTEEALKNISELFNVCTNIKTLDFYSNNGIGSTTQPLFTSLKRSANTLENINLSCCNLEEKAINNISELFKVCTNIKSLDFFRNDNVGTTKHSLFENLKMSSSTLRDIDFFACDLKEEVIKNISELFKVCTNIKSLNFRDNKGIGCTKHPIFTNLKMSSNTLEVLNFNGCDLKEEAIENISELFKYCTNIKCLDFYRNKGIGSTKHPIFSNLKMSSHTLEDLNLNGCDLKEDAIKNISELFKVCTNIRRINLCENNEIGSTKHPIFLCMNTLSKTLEILNLTACSLNDEAMKNLCELFKVCTNIKSLEFCRNKIISSTKQPLFESLNMSSNTLEMLNLASCDLEEKDFEDIQKMFNKCIVY